MGVRLEGERLVLREWTDEDANDLEANDDWKRKPVPTERVSRDGDLPLSFMQQRLWFLARLEPDLCAYNIPMSWRLRGALDVYMTLIL